MHAITRRHLLKLGLASGALVAMANSPAQALVSIVVSGGNFTPLPIAIPDFASSDPSFGKEIADIVRADLTRSGLFAPIDPATFGNKVGDVNATPVFADWRALNVDALVMGQVERGGQIQSAVRVWDTAAAQQVVGNTYNADPQSDRRIAHIVADAIYASLAGDSGYFDSQVVFIAESGPKANRKKQLAIMDQDGQNIQMLSSGDSLTLGPEMSDDRSMITYTSYEDGNPQVYVAQLGGKSRKLINNAPMSFASHFSPDGSAVAFSVSNNGVTNLYSAGVSGSKPVQLTSGAEIDTAPSYSPDGSKIVFESDRGGQPQIYIMSAGGGGAQRISYGDGEYSTPTWSPKGDLIAFTRQANGNFQIGTMKPDGTGERILVDSFHAEGPSFCPNGRVIMFFRDPGGDSGPGLWTVDIWGRNEQQIKMDIFASDPNWCTLRS
ncbi:MAG TPA: Tol-Pal system beta propeller repeat protein TolB [Devosia sp.]|nr:Tol-Pal system beta propeller repeat protein TolB [Devosia sp.]